MRILILTQNYIPEPDTKMHILATGLLKRGHQVTVITAFPNYPQGKIYPGYKQRLWLRENIDGVRVIRLPLYPNRSRSALKRMANYMSFAVSASALGPALCGPADVMLAYHPPASLAVPARTIGLFRRLPLVYEIQDMWPETLEATGISKNRWVFRVVDRMCHFAYGQASAITVITPGYKSNLIEKGVPSHKIHVLMNWGYEGEFQPAEPDVDLARQLGLEGRFNIVYAGNMGPAQGLFNVLDAADLLTDLTDVQFVLVGDGLDRPKLEKAVKERELSNVRLLPRMPMSQMPSLYSIADSLLIHLTNDSLFEITIPGKTQSYLGSGRPLMVSVSGAAADLILKAGAGVVARPSDPADLARVVRELYHMPAAEREAMGNSGRDYYLKNLTPEVLIDRYEDLFTQLVKSEQPERELIRR